jgi:cobalt/nickel transport protein
MRLSRQFAPLAALVAVLATITAPARAHFQVLIPSRDVFSPADGRTVDLEVLFTHPMENGPVMEMAPPKQFGVLADGEKLDLLDQLQRKPIDGKSAYSCSAKLRRPGDHVFYLEPAPYWEPGERKMIVHYTKVVVDFLGAETGWDSLVGLPVEIEPLVRPYGLWTGNIFRGIVRRDGKPVPFATVEVEYLNADEKLAIPNDAFVTQTVKADAQGVFSYSMPRAGWWGFAALVDGEQPMTAPTGEKVDVELGGLIWVQTVDMKERPAGD